MKNILSLSKLSLFSAVLVTTLFLLSTTSFAVIFTVTNLDDSGAGSLRQAIFDANHPLSSPGPDEIVFDVGLTGTITLSTGEMFITDDLTITGPGAGAITIDAQMMDRIFNIDDLAGTEIVVSISGLMFINGSHSSGGAVINFEDLSIDACVFENNISFNGGVIHNQGTLTEITNSTFSGNSADSGGVIDNFLGTIVKITNSTFSGNNAEAGGVILNGGPIGEITNSTFSGNSADSGGGAIWNASPGTIEKITNSTFSGNSATGRGGAIFNQIDRTIEEITNCTFSGNSTGIDGGAIWNDGDMNISFTTIANNQAADEGGGIFENGASIRIRNSIVAFNTATTSGPNCNGDITTLVTEINNYSNDGSCGFDGDNSTILLGPLANNGGPTQTLALLGGDPLDGASPACDPLNRFGIPTGVSLPIDQRHFSRPFGASTEAPAPKNNNGVTILSVMK